MIPSLKQKPLIEFNMEHISKGAYRIYEIGSRRYPSKRTIIDVMWTIEMSHSSNIQTSSTFNVFFPFKKKFSIKHKLRGIIITHFII